MTSHPSARAANSWHSYNTPEFCMWNADFAADTPAADLLAWQHLVLGAGEEHQIFRVERVEQFGYDRTRDGDFRDYLATRPERIVDPHADPGFPPGFVLTDSFDYWPLGALTSTLLHYIDREGNINQAWIHQMRDLEQQIDNIRLYDEPPLEIGGNSLFDDLPDRLPLNTNFSISTDIFFPWNPNPPRDPMDNRVLARLNGARLYAFLRQVRDAARAIGGTWAGYPLELQDGYPLGRVTLGGKLE